MNTIKCALTALLVAICTAAARAGDGFEPPAKAFDTDWASIAVAAIALVAIGVLGFKSSKRSHLD